MGEYQALLNKVTLCSSRKHGPIFTVSCLCYRGDVAYFDGLSETPCPWGWSNLKQVKLHNSYLSCVSCIRSHISFVGVWLNLTHRINIFLQGFSSHTSTSSTPVDVVILGLSFPKAQAACLEGYSCSRTRCTPSPQTTPTTWPSPPLIWDASSWQGKMAAYMR
ncbi:unnamed protein product [Oncorhynchus mykiss]|uniref:Uncharacterized protein n=1 Tax=Oncorhynchus mykiss TaxID=8022 RepID=A0A060X9H0_ONCMY|nr:unnamed protein product [Oncorhynchus mykiss]